MTKLAAITLLSSSYNASSTEVLISTSQGDIEISLYDETTPLTVANFLSYVTNGDYDNTIIHRSIPGFIIQGGGFSFNGASLTAITTQAPVNNEPEWSNVTGTIAMAKLATGPNSATSQWFFNMSNNSANLDLQNSGFTVFGQVIGDGMTVLNTIANLTHCSDIPSPERTPAECSDSSFVPGVENFVTINSVTISDSTVDTTDGLTLVENTLIDNPPSTGGGSNSSSGGGSFSWLSLVFLATIRLLNRKK